MVNKHKLGVRVVFFPLGPVFLEHEVNTSAAVLHLDKNLMFQDNINCQPLSCKTISFLYENLAMSCFNCINEHESVKTCSRCKINTYCSVRCQTAHWRRHKPNCLPSDAAVHQLFKACRQDLFPATTDPIWWQFGFANVSQYHKSVVSKEGLDALQILLGLYQAIRIDVSLAEDGYAGQPPRNTMGMSKKMLQKAYETNTLDDLLHHFISNSTSNYGNNVAKYLFWWREYKLMIGPTRPTTGDKKEWQKVKKEMREKIYTKYYQE